MPGGFTSSRARWRQLRLATESGGSGPGAYECQDETIIRLHGGHIVRLPCSLEEVLSWPEP